MLSPKKCLEFGSVLEWKCLKQYSLANTLEMSKQVLARSTVIKFFLQLNVNSYKWLRVNRAFIASAGLIIGVEAISSKIAPKRNAYNPHSMPIKPFIVGNF